MTRKIDELNNLKSKRPKPEEYFGEMDIPEEDKEERVQFAEKANELFNVILILLLTMRDNGKIDYFYVRELLETWYISLLNEYIEPDDYTIELASETAFDFVETTKNHVDDDSYYSEDRALLNAENAASEAIEYKRYKEALAEGKKEKKWVTKQDNKERETHKVLNGTRIPIQDNFIVGVVPMRFPMDTLYGNDPREIVNCRCHCEYYPKRDKESVENTDNNDIINSEEQVRARQTILQRVESGQYNLDYNRNKYREHIEGTRDYINTTKTRGGREPSRLNLSYDEAVELMKKSVGTGLVQIVDGKVFDREYVSAEKYIGEIQNKGKWIKTKRFAIHYGSKHSHIVPVEENAKYV